MNTKVSVKGVYKVNASPEACEDALSTHGDEAFVKSELSSLVLVELDIKGADHKFDLADFKQSHTEYVPYDETFFELETGNVIKPRTGLGYSVFTDKAGHLKKYITATNETTDVTVEELEQYHLPGARDFTVVFFLHFFDENESLETPYGRLSLPAPEPLPQRLSWKKYTHWC